MKKVLTTRYHATQEEMPQRHPHAEPVPGTEEVLILAEDPLANSSAHLQSSR